MRNTCIISTENNKRENIMNKEIQADLKEIIKISEIVIPEKQKEFLKRLANQKIGQFTPRGNKAK